MSNQWYDKNEYENYPSYLLGKTKEGSQQQFVEQKKEGFSNTVRGDYDFSGDTFFFIAGGYGISGNIRISGHSYISNYNNLEVSASATCRHEIKISGYVIVSQNGSIFSRDNFSNARGTLYSSGAHKPLGIANVKLPFSGEYEVKVVVSGEVTVPEGKAYANYTTKLPYSK